MLRTFGHIHRLRRGFSELRVCGLRSFATANSQSYVQVDKVGDVAILRLDDPTSKVNTLSAAMQESFQSALKQAEADSSVRAVVLISSKKDCFIAGADINMLSACKTATELADLSRQGQKVFADLLAKGKPKVAAIDGSCLGGGLEVALACHYRVASSNRKTTLALPEVMLGLLPGAGGTQRLPPLIGIQAALPLLLTGKNVKAAKAKRMGLVDSVADPAALEAAAVLAAQQLADGSLKPKRAFKGAKGAIEWALTGTSFGRNFVFDKARKQVMKQTAGNYPAPLAILDVVKEGFENGPKAGYEAEATRFGELGMTPESRALISIFNGQTALKKNRFVDKQTQPRPVKTIGVLGAGLMGAGIAQVSVANDYKVLLKDTQQAGLDRGVQQISGNLDGRVKRRAMTLVEKEGIMSRVVGLTADDEQQWRSHFSQADLVVEAVFEDLDVKHNVVRELESAVPEHCIIATNTSALPIAEIAKASARPENVLGMHYFSPVDKMPLLEIIPHEGTSKDVLAAAFEVGRRQGKTVVVVKDVPGFYVNRCLGPYMAECMALLQLGVAPDRLDKVMKNFGFPVGPISLADEVGIDVAGHVQEFLGANLGDRMKGAVGGATLLPAMLDAKLLGRKSGAGFYKYGKGKKGKKELNEDVKPLLEKFCAATKPLELTDEEIQFRATCRFVNESAHCLADGIVESAVDGDIAAIFGIGYPPFRGGPFRYVDAVGVSTFVDRMQKLADEHGPQFTPAPILVEYAKTNKLFHEK